MRPTNVIARFLTGLLLALPASAVRGHDSWMAVESRGPRGLVVALTTGDAFPRHDFPVALARLERAELVEGERRVPLLPMQANAHALRLRAVPRDASAVLAVASLQASTISLEPDSVKVYVEGELGGDTAVLRRYAEQGRWRERYRKHLKLIARANHAAAGIEAPTLAAVTTAATSNVAASRATTSPQGLAFELVPSTDPTMLAPGVSFDVCAYAHDAPVTRAYIGLVESDGAASWQWSDARGCVRVAPKSPRGFLLRSIHLRAVDDAAIDWESDFASLTVYRLDEAHAASSSLATPDRGTAHAH